MTKSQREDEERLERRGKGGEEGKERRVCTLALSCVESRAAWGDVIVVWR
jgi:hypothetical protein